jgi:hypothetical protein
MLTENADKLPHVLQRSISPRGSDTKKNHLKHEGLKIRRILLAKSAQAHAGRVRLAQEAAHDQPLSS